MAQKLNLLQMFRSYLVKTQTNESLKNLSRHEIPPVLYRFPFSDSIFHLTFTLFLEQSKSVCYHLIWAVWSRNVQKACLWTRLELFKPRTIEWKHIAKWRKMLQPHWICFESKQRKALLDSDCGWTSRKKLLVDCDKTFHWNKAGWIAWSS